MKALFLSLLLIFPRQSTDVRWYGPEYDGRKTANGEIFSHHELTAASSELRFGTKVLIRYGDKSVTVRVNDRGPSKLELTSGAFEKLAPLAAGKINVTYEIINE